MFLVLRIIRVLANSIPSLQFWSEGGASKILSCQSSDAYHPVWETLPLMINFKILSKAQIWLGKLALSFLSSFLPLPLPLPPIPHPPASTPTPAVGNYLWLLSTPFSLVPPWLGICPSVWKDALSYPGPPDQLHICHLPAQTSFFHEGLPLPHPLSTLFTLLLHAVCFHCNNHFSFLFAYLHVHLPTRSPYFWQWGWKMWRFLSKTWLGFWTSSPDCDLGTNHLPEDGLEP